MARAGQASHAAAFADAVRAFVTVPVQLQDERLSTVAATRSLHDAARARSGSER
jgi:RNase H-fold protein (predicted Holliday junction resolvase)